MEKFLLFSLLYAVAACLTYFTAPFAAREKKGAWLLHLGSVGGIMFAVMYLTLHTPIDLAIVLLSVYALIVYLAARFLYLKKIEEHDPNHLKTVREDQKQKEKNKQFHYIKWFEKFKLSFTSVFILIIWIRALLEVL